jgi:hypothetical protein
MSAAERLDERNDVMIALADIDAKLTERFGDKPSYRSAAECRELLDIRDELAATLISMGGQPGPAPVSLPFPKVVA